MSTPLEDPAQPTELDVVLMRRALEEARRAADVDEVPVGAVLAIGDQVVAVAHNRREASRDPTAHAELLAITEAARALGRWRLFDACLYVTLEPCPMCAGAAVNARVARVVFGAPDPKAGALRSLYRIGDDARLNHRMEVVGGVLSEECGALLSDFFKKKREQRGPSNAG